MNPLVQQKRSLRLLPVIPRSFEKASSYGVNKRLLSDAPTLRSGTPQSRALVAVASVLLGCGVPVALVPCLVAKPAYSGEHQGRPNPRSVWLHQ